MIYLTSIMGLGDCLITLSILEKNPEIADRCAVIGSDTTLRVASLLENVPVKIVNVLPDVAAFYVLREKGLRAALSDIGRFRKWAKQTLQSSDSIIFEKADWRNRFLVPSGKGRVHEISRDHGAYKDRAEKLSSLLGIPMAFSACESPRGKAKSLVINPSARFRDRFLPERVVEEIVSVAVGAGMEVCLIDTLGLYADCASKVSRYLKKPTLAESDAALRSAGRYIGPDSFFMHLAYYRRIPFLGFFHPSNMYFSPPGMLQLGNYLNFSEAGNAEKLRSKLNWFFCLSA